MNFLHPDNADELALIAKETGAEVLRGSRLAGAIREKQERNAAVLCKVEEILRDKDE